MQDIAHHLFTAQQTVRHEFTGTDNSGRRHFDLFWKKRKKNVLKIRSGKFENKKAVSHKYDVIWKKKFSNETQELASYLDQLHSGQLAFRVYS